MRGASYWIPKESELLEMSEPIFVCELSHREKQMVAPELARLQDLAIQLEALNAERRSTEQRMARMVDAVMDGEIFTIDPESLNVFVMPDHLVGIDIAAGVKASQRLSETAKRRVLVALGCDNEADEQ